GTGGPGDDRVYPAQGSGALVPGPAAGTGSRRRRQRGEPGGPVRVLQGQRGAGGGGRPPAGDRPLLGPGGGGHPGALPGRGSRGLSPAAAAEGDGPLALLGRRGWAAGGEAPSAS